MIRIFRILFFLFSYTVINACLSKKNESLLQSAETFSKSATDTTLFFRQIDTSLFNLKMKQLANGDQSGRWPPKTDYPLAGALLPYKRIVAYYGNFYSAQMGVLGQYPEKDVIQKLKTEIIKWETADTLSPVIPAIHYIAVTAQKKPGADGKYRLRMPCQQIEKAIEMASLINGIVFLDIQAGFSSLEQEIPRLKKYLQLQQVHLGIDPEYAMKNGTTPGTAIGTFDAEDINYASQYLSEIVNKYRLPPKMLVVHRFTKAMLTNYKKIKIRKEVQLIINMDGFGVPQRKKNTYHHVIFKEPVQFAGFKLFYKNDTLNAKQLLTPDEILKLKPQPIYIQYQ